MKDSKLSKIIVILGPTASGKTEWGIRVAREFGGEVVSADSRQVYKHMDIGTAKPAAARGKGKGERGTRDEGRGTGNNMSIPPRQLPRAPSWKEGDDSGEVYVVDGVVHHLMDVVEPSEGFTVADFKERAMGVIEDILRRGKLPIVVGGTGLYIQALVDNLEIPRVAPDNKLRVELEKKTLDEQVAMLKKIDPESAKIIDLKNPRRVLRALEVAIGSGESFLAQQKKGAPLYNALQIGIEWPREVLYERINGRVDEQMKSGLVEETKGLVERLGERASATPPEPPLGKRGVTGDSVWLLPSMSGIGYRQMGYYLRGEMTLPEAVEMLKRDTRRYAKRQMTWFKRDERIKWMSDYGRAETEVKKFLK